LPSSLIEWCSWQNGGVHVRPLGSVLTRAELRVVSDIAMFAK
jgi:hypothetical protein